MSMGPLDKARDLVDDLRHLPDQRKHDMRHAGALERTRGLGRPRVALIMCAGTVCHSFYAAARLRTLIAGTPLAGMVVQTEVDNLVHRASGPAHDVAAARGVVLLSPTDAPVPEGVAPDLLLVMGEAQALRSKGRWSVDPSRIFILGDFDPLAIRHRELSEPEDGNAEMYEASYERIDRCLQTLVSALLSAA